MKTPVTGKSLHDHLTYSWWKYVLFTVLAVFSVNLYYSVSTYRSPEEKKVEMYIYGLADEKGLNDYMTRIRLTDMPDMEEMSARMLMTDTQYGPMQLTTYIAAGEADIYLLPSEQFKSMAGEKAFLPLESDTELMGIFEKAGASLRSGWRRDPDDGEDHIYGLPLSALPGLDRYCYVENGYVCVLYANRNTENVLKFLRILCTEMVNPPAAVPESDAAAPEAAAQQEPSPESDAGNSEEADTPDPSVSPLPDSPET